MLGDAAGMLAASQRMMTVWSPDRPAAGFLLGCHAFAIEEHGAYAAAEAYGRQAVAMEPDDAWGLHAVSHVHEMRGETADGHRLAGEQPRQLVPLQQLQLPHGLAPGAAASRARRA